MEGIYLRALEPNDIDVLFSIENDSSLWKYSNRNEPFSRFTLNKYIESQDQDLYELKQKRFVLSNKNRTVLGLVDLFDFEPFHRRAGVGILIVSEFQNKGFGVEAIKLLENQCKLFYNMHLLYANIPSENSQSIKLFKKMNFSLIGVKKSWNYYENSFHDEYLYQKIID
jgi:diamine N-acetyltransferase